MNDVDTVARLVDAAIQMRERAAVARALGPVYAHAPVYVELVSQQNTVNARRFVVSKCLEATRGDKFVRAVDHVAGLVMGADGYMGYKWDETHVADRVVATEMGHRADGKTYREQIAAATFLGASPTGPLAGLLVGGVSAAAMGDALVSAEIAPRGLIATVVARERDAITERPEVASLNAAVRAGRGKGRAAADPDVAALGAFLASLGVDVTSAESAVSFMVKAAAKRGGPGAGTDVAVHPAIALSAMMSKKRWSEFFCACADGDADATALQAQLLTIPYTHRAEFVSWGAKFSTPGAVRRFVRAEVESAREVRGLASAAPAAAATPTEAPAVVAAPVVAAPVAEAAEAVAAVLVPLAAPKATVKGVDGVAGGKRGRGERELVENENENAAPNAIRAGG